MSKFVKVEGKNCKVKVILRLLVYYIKFTYLECTELTEVVGRKGGYPLPPLSVLQKLLRGAFFCPQNLFFDLFKNSF